MGDDAPYALFRDDRAGKSLVFAEPDDLVIARSAGEVRPALARLEAARQAGKWLAGYLSYEAGFVFEDKLAPLIEDGRETPLVAFGIFDAPENADHPLAAAPSNIPNAPFLTNPRAAWDSKPIAIASSACTVTCARAIVIRQTSPCRSRPAGAATPAPPSGRWSAASPCITAP